MRNLSASVVLVVASLGLFYPSQADAGPPARSKKPQAKKGPALPDNSPGLLAFFRKRIPSAVDRAKIAALIEQLTDDEFENREKATEELVAIGPVAVPFLQRALHDDDPEIATRAKTSLERIERDNDPGLVAAAAGLLVKLKPAGGAEVLLAFLPFARDETAAEAVQAALGSLAVRNGKVEPVLLKALQDKLPAKRIAAARALLQGGPAGLRKDLRKLLQDKEPVVRFRVAMGFVGVKDKDGIPVLIALLGRLPRDQEIEIEDLLYRLAGDQVPAKVQEKDVEATQAREAWSGWWRKHGPKLDLAKLDTAHALRGHTLIVKAGLRGDSSVLEIGRDGKTRWEITGLRGVKDAQVIGKDRVLIAEYTGRKITERDFKGKVLWEKVVRLPPIGCLRLANGNTFIVMRRQILEVDKDGQEVFSYFHRLGNICSAQKTRRGEIVLVDSSGNFSRLDKQGKVLKSFRVGNIYPLGGSFDLLPNDRVVVPDYLGGRVVEYDKEGKERWEARFVRPTSVQRLPNGNTLVASMFSNQVVELDRKGKLVWKYKVEGRPIRARRR
jgi:hypothetical protein